MALVGDPIVSVSCTAGGRLSEVHSQAPNLLSMLEQLLPVRFISLTDDMAQTTSQVRFEAASRTEVTTLEEVSILDVPSEISRFDNSSDLKVEVRFADSSEVPFPFRGRNLVTRLKEDYRSLVLRRDEQVLANGTHGPIWTVSITGSTKHFRSALPLPRLDAQENFSDVFGAESFLGLLPLLHFLRSLHESTVRANSTLRASFIVDDPNLHWPRYGFVDYREMAKSARRENCHFSFATIPLDAWFTHSGTAELFRANMEWLSLLVHGNNHGREELARSYPRAVRRALLKQGLRRIARLERKAKLAVSKVMVPPHGACSAEMLAELPGCGFESACISAASLRAHNTSSSWVRTLGYHPAEFIEGCPVLPRRGLTGSVTNSLLLAAYLGQPMILRGHHHDLRSGLELFQEYAKFINGIGHVIWANMATISRLSYSSRMVGSSCRLRPSATKLDFVPPVDATELVIENAGALRDLEWQLEFSDGTARRVRSGERVVLPDAMVQSMAQALSLPTSVEDAEFRTYPTLILRRILTEARDRVTPFHNL